MNFNESYTLDKPTDLKKYGGMTTNGLRESGQVKNYTFIPDPRINTVGNPDFMNGVLTYNGLQPLNSQTIDKSNVDVVNSAVKNYAQIGEIQKNDKRSYYADYWNVDVNLEPLMRNPLSSGISRNKNGYIPGFYALSTPEDKISVETLYGNKNENKIQGPQGAILTNDNPFLWTQGTPLKFYTVDNPKTYGQSSLVFNPKNQIC